MSRPPAPRSVLGMIYKHFIRAMQPRQVYGDLVGKDHLGNKYYETPIQKNSERTRPSRYYITESKDDFELEIPPEWMAWLRYRRKEPPTEEEIHRNIQAMLQVQENVRKLEEERLKKLDNKQLATVEEKETIKSFPRYGDEYEDLGGQELHRKTKY